MVGSGNRHIGLLGPWLAWLLAAVPAAADESVLFRLSARCLACHNGISSTRGEDLSLGTDWQSSVMANAARDPYWQGAVRREILDHPESRAAIENECTRCHMPMATVEDNLHHRAGVAFRHLVPESRPPERSRLARDGVSCSVCHQITDERLGNPASFVGHFVLDTRSGWGHRREYGPFPVDAARVSVMRSATGFVPASANHIRDSALCATCHTLYTEALGPAGAVIGRLPEQVPYLEWLNSDYVRQKSCPACHMPAVNDGTPFTSVLPETRRGWRRHTFRGGNFLLERIMAVHGAALESELGSGGFELARQQTVEFLRATSARLALSVPRLDRRRLEVDVIVTNLSGHKLPTAYPSRRVFVHLTVWDRAGQFVFESGRLEPNGSIVGNDNDREPSRFEPHHRTIERPDQVQIYESIMGDSAGHATTGLLSALGYLKDNRLLPRGFVVKTASGDVAVRGEAGSDADFVGGEDRVRYRVPVDPQAGPFRVRAELWFQPVGYRWAYNLSGYRAREPQRFFDLYRSLSRVSATLLASAERR